LFQTSLREPDFRDTVDKKALRRYAEKRELMKLVILLILWCVLFVLCWPLAVFVALLLPVVWLLSIPFRVLIYVVDATLALLKTLLFLPARLLGYRPSA
jgi:hypothetical protein